MRLLRSLAAFAPALFVGLLVGLQAGPSGADATLGPLVMLGSEIAVGTGSGEGWVDDPLAGSQALANQPPVACFTASPTIGYAPLTVTFNSSCSYDPDGYIFSRIWTFGDGVYGGGAVSVSYTYTVPGTYIASLTLNDNQGFIAQAYQVITVRQRGCPFRICT